MEQVIVEATRVDAHPSLFGRHNVWLYVAVPDYEILSLSDSEQTLATARHIADSLALDREFIPADYLAPLSTPMSFIIFDHEPTKPMEALIPNSNDTVASPDFGRFAFQTPWAGGGTDVADSDTHCVVQNRWGARWLWGGGGLGRGPIPTGILFQLSQCVPALPLWYQYGFIGPCGLLRMAGLSDGTGRVLAKATWVSDSETNAILSAVKKTKALPKIPPIEDLFIPNGPAGVKSITAWPSPVWMAEAALFLRWGLFGEPDKAESHLQQFALFIERSRVEPVNEPLFRQCFGFGYAEMQSRLSEFLVDAARQPIVISNLVFKHWVPHPDPNYPVLPNLDLTFRTFETRYRATLSL